MEELRLLDRTIIRAGVLCDAIEHCVSEPHACFNSVLDWRSSRHSFHSMVHPNNYNVILRDDPKIIDILCAGHSSYGATIPGRHDNRELNAHSYHSVCIITSVAIEEYTHEELELVHMWLRTESMYSSFLDEEAPPLSERNKRAKGIRIMHGLMGWLQELSKC